MSGADQMVETYRVPSTASPSEKQLSSLVFSLSEGYKTGSAGSKGSGKPVYLVLRAAPTKAGPVLREETASAPDASRNTSSAREWALEFTRSSGSESGLVSGAAKTTTMRKRSTSAQRVGVAATQSDRERKTSSPGHISKTLPRGQTSAVLENAEARLNRLLEEDGAKHVSVHTVYLRFHRSVGDEVSYPSQQQNALTSDAVRQSHDAGNGESSLPPVAAVSSSDAPGRQPYRSPPGNIGPYGPPPPPPSGGDRPPPSQSNGGSAGPQCPLCPIYRQRIFDLNARHDAVVRAKADDEDVLRDYIANERSIVVQLQGIIEGHEQRIDDLDNQLLGSNQEINDHIELSNNAESTIAALKIAIGREMKGAADEQTKAAAALAMQTDQQYQAHAMNAQNLQMKITDINVLRGREGQRAIYYIYSGRAETARITELLNSAVAEGNTEIEQFTTIVNEQKRFIAARGERVAELEAIPEASAASDESGVEALKQQVGELQHGLVTGAQSSSALEPRITVLMDQIQVLNSNAVTAELKANYILENVTNANAKVDALRRSLDEASQNLTRSASELDVAKAAHVASDEGGPLFDKLVQRCQEVNMRPRISGTS
eukprot:16452343-Heterocapsa_arctica.AAC.1